MGLPFHPLWLIILLAIVLIIFGPGKLPELGGAVGRASGRAIVQADQQRIAGQAHRRQEMSAIHEGCLPTC